MRRSAVELVIRVHVLDAVGILEPHDPASPRSEHASGSCGTEQAGWPVSHFQQGQKRSLVER